MEQKYKVEERVKVCGWVREDFGIIKDITWIYHNRVGQHCWGYNIVFEGEGPGLTFVYIPEGYLRKIEED